MVSIIIPCYNMEKYIGDCLESCMRQRYVNVEIVVVDDCSTDSSLEIASLIYDPRLKIIKMPENRGVSAARNRGLEYAFGEYIVFLDADDMLMPSSIKARVKYLDDHPTVDMVWGNAYKINQDRHNYKWGYSQCLAAYGSLEVYSRRCNAQTIMWRRRVFEKHGLYYEKLRSKEDKEMLFRLGLHPDSPMPKAIKAKKLNQFMAIYRRHPKAKHKMRVADKAWFKETEIIFNRRIKRLQKEGITPQNTRWFKNELA